MASLGKTAPRRKTGRERGSSPPCERPAGSSGVVDSSSARRRDAGEGSGGLREGAGQSLSLAGAVGEIANYTVETGPFKGRKVEDALANPDFLASASRWRGGSVQRQMTAALARAAKYFKTLRPGLLKEPTKEDSPSLDELPPVSPLPLATSDAKGGFLTWLTVFTRQVKHWAWRKCTSWAPILVGLVLVLLYPKLVATLLVLLVRLLCRAMVVIASRCLMAIWSEVNGLVWQALETSWMIEDHAVAVLEESWIGRWNGATASAPQGPQLSSSSFTQLGPAAQAGTIVGGPTPPPPYPPWSVSLLVLAVMGYQYRRPAQGGVGL